MAQVQLLLLFVFLPTLLCWDGDERDEGTGCPKRLGRNCICGLANYRAWAPNRQVYITNCTNTGFTDASIIEAIPTETEVLIMTGNKFNRLPWNLLGIWDDHNKLEVIDLTNNQIQEIQGKSFHKVNAVKRLILDHNDLYIVSTMNHPRMFSNFHNLTELHLTNAFTEQVDSKWYLEDLKNVFLSSELTKLEKLHLEQNEIWEIRDNDMFCDLPNLLDIYLADNQLTEINFSLDCLERFRYLDVSFNKIRNLKTNTREKIDKVFSPRSNTSAGRDYDSQIDLHGNPFRCDCEMNGMFDWLTNTAARIVNKREMRCYDGFPEYNAGIRIENVVFLECAPRQHQEYSSHTAITSTLLGVLIVITTTLLLIVLWINRVTVKEKFTPLVENFKTSLQYSTLEKQEETPEVHV